MSNKDTVCVWGKFSCSRDTLGVVLRGWGELTAHSQYIHGHLSTTATSFRPGWRSDIYFFWNLSKVTTCRQWLKRNIANEFKQSLSSTYKKSQIIMYGAFIFLSQNPSSILRHDQYFFLNYLWLSLLVASYYTPTSLYAHLSTTARSKLCRDGGCCREVYYDGVTKTYENW